MKNNTRRGMRVRTHLKAGPRGCGICGFTLNTAKNYANISIPATGGFQL